jgi:hypothetical protein
MPFLSNKQWIKLILIPKRTHTHPLNKQQWLMIKLQALLEHQNKKHGEKEGIDWI